MSRSPQFLLLLACLWMGIATPAWGEEEPIDPSFGVPEVQRFTLGHEVLSVAVSPDGKLVAARDAEGKLYLWDRVLGKEITLPTGRGKVSAVAFAPDGRRLAAAEQDGSVRFWDVAARHEMLRLVGHSSRVLALAFSPDGKLLATGGGKGYESEEKPDGRRVVTEPRDRTLRLWDAATGEELRRWEDFASEVTAVAFAPDGRRLACISGDWDNRIVVHDVGSGKVLAQCRGPGGWMAIPAFSSIAFAPDGKTIASAGTHQHTLELWDAATGTLIRMLPDRGARGAGVVAFAPDGRTLASADWLDHNVVLWDPVAGEPRAYCLEHTETVDALAFTANSRTLVTGGRDCTVRVWDVAGWPSRKRDRPETWTPEKLTTLWDDLGDARPAQAYRALRGLIADPGTVAFLDERLRQATNEPKDVKRLVAGLDSDDFAVRDRAARELERLGLAAAPALRQALAAKPSAEVRRQAERLLELVREPTSSPTTRRALRAIEVLERLDTPEVCRLLEELGKGTPDAWLTLEAQAALKRLGG